ncbi:MAG: S16 family serine protease [Hyphomicrobiales bacterium]
MVFFRREDPPVSGTPQAAPPDELQALQQAVENANLPPSASAVATNELNRLRKTDSSLPEYTLTQSYLDFLISLPWNRSTNDNLDLARAESILSAEHFGLGHVKERIIEYLVVQTLRSQQTFQLLVVDDEKIARTNLEYVLTKEGYRVDTAGNGAEALTLLEKQRYDLLLTDLKMDQMDGNQLLDAAKRLDADIQVVMVTGFATVGSAVEAFRKGAAHYLPKPVKIDELRSVVRQILELKKHLHMKRSPVLCFAGPPGTGKTSIGRGIAAALERRFIRISLAGLRDEAELRGHRRTYVGAMPGRILNEIRRAAVNNPVFMLDEIDKIGQDFQGDAASVLLELLDPEQNAHFVDHYLDLPFDLSAAIFIATANVIERIPSPLRDRLELIDFPGYTEKEKLKIAQHFLIPRQVAANSLARQSIAFSDAAVLKIIRDYTREAGLRNLEREIAAICRKMAKLCVQGPAGAGAATIDDRLVETFLGPRKVDHGSSDAGGRVGVVTGLVWTEFGGEIIFVEAGIMNGGQQLILTGSLGQVLQESAQTALSYVRSHAAAFGISPEFFAGHDIHIHIPSAGISKDGPSAGLTIAVALISLLSGKAVRPHVAMTGELSLSGRILPICGLKEKVLAAQRAGIKTVIVPRANSPDVGRLEPDITEGLEVILVDQVEAVVDRVLEARGAAQSSMR